MKIEEIVGEYAKVPFEHLLNADTIQQIKATRRTLSKSEKRFFLQKLSKFKDFDATYISNIILIYSIWHPNEAIREARKKGVFRYKAWGFKKNYAEYLLKQIQNSYSYLNYSDDTKKFVSDKLNISWIFDFYKKTEESLLKYIHEHHRKREIIRKGNIFYEEALFKDLLAYLDYMFYSNHSTSNASNKNNNASNKNKLESYSHEEISEGISYIIYLYDTNIGIKEDCNYIALPEYVSSEEIEAQILLACKINQLQEWEISIDYFDYKLRTTNNKEAFIFDSKELFEKSLRLGYIKTDMQGAIFHKQNDLACIDKDFSLFEGTKIIKSKFKNELMTSIEAGKLSRFRFEFPEPLFVPFQNHNILFKEECLTLAYTAREFIMDFDEVSDKKITNHCSLKDVLLFQRFFVLMNSLAADILFKQSNKNKVIRSLIPYFRKEVLIELLTKFVGDKVKVEELMDLFTYNKGRKLDLQYTPFLQLSNGIGFSNSVIVKSNLLRNCIAYSYSSNNKIVNQDDKETLVRECEKVFSERHSEYKVFANKRFKYDGQDGEVDVLVVSENDIIVIECKAPLNPTSNFELRASYDHVNKAVKQLDHCKAAFSDKAFRKSFLKDLKVAEKPRNIHTCIVFGNRLFNGYEVSGHPIRYVRELDMILNNGHVFSEFGKWRVWKNEEFMQRDLISFLSSQHPLITINFEAMEPRQEYMYVKSRKVCFETYQLNFVKVIELYDKNFHLKEKNESMRSKFLGTK